MHVHLLFGLSQPYMMEHVPAGITAFREVLIFEANLIVPRGSGGEGNDFSIKQHRFGSESLYDEAGGNSR